MFIIEWDENRTNFTSMFAFHFSDCFQLHINSQLFQRNLVVEEFFNFFLFLLCKVFSSCLPVVESSRILVELREFISRLVFLFIQQAVCVFV